MIQFICLFLPAFIALKIVMIFSKKVKTLYDLIINYFLFVVLINFTNIFILVFIFLNDQSVIDYNSFNNSFAFKYLAISIVLALLFGTMFDIIEKKVKVKLQLVKTKNDSVIDENR